MSFVIKRFCEWVRARYIAAMLLMGLLTLWTGCGDVFRPVANPIPGVNPDPKNFHFALVASQNAPGNPGSGMQIDVSGDSTVGIVNAGQQPVYGAVLANGSRGFIANNDGTVTAFSPAGFFGSIGSPTTITMPQGLVPTFLQSTEAATMYAATSTNGSGPCPNSAGGEAAVVAISAISDAVKNFACLGNNASAAGLAPVLIAELPNGQKLYTVNGDGSVSTINTINMSLGPLLFGGSTQAAGAASSVDGSQLFVLDKANGAIVSINSFTDAIASTAANAADLQGASFLLLDAHLNRLYAVNPASNKVAIYDASTANASQGLPPRLIRTLTLPPAASNPVMATALNNGTKVYVVSSQAGGSSATAEVTVIRTLDNSISSVISLPSVTPNANVINTCLNAGGVSGVRFPVSITSASNAQRVYVANCFAGSTTAIDTATDRIVVPLKSPVSAFPPAPGSQGPPPQSPVWVVAGP
ncbi:MAG TPA: hypothetical protein VFI95_13900 [Terriglobales bacterium]|nr:hypothetical protein [Terriglobales bacterium]